LNLSIALAIVTFVDILIVRGITETFETREFIDSAPMDGLSELPPKDSSPSDVSPIELSSLIYVVLLLTSLSSESMAIWAKLSSFLPVTLLTSFFSFSFFCRSEG